MKNPRLLPKSHPFTLKAMTELKELKEQLKTLLAQRDLLEIEADALHSELMSPGLNGEPPAGVKDALVDNEGFPRADVDIYNVKHKRARLSTINFDHKALMKTIEGLLLRIHDLTETEPAVEAKPREPEPAVEYGKPIAILDELLEGSPAAAAGIVNGDLLLQFGHVTSAEPSPLPAIAKLVGESVSKVIVVVVRRGAGEQVMVRLVPRTWAGRGLLGCHLTPYHG